MDTVGVRFLYLATTDNLGVCNISVQWDVPDFVMSHKFIVSVTFLSFYPCDKRTNSLLMS